MEIKAKVLGTSIVGTDATLHFQTQAVRDNQPPDEFMVSCPAYNNDGTPRSSEAIMADLINAARLKRMAKYPQQQPEIQAPKDFDL